MATKSSSNCLHVHCVKSVRIWSYSGPHFPVFGLNTERYSVSLYIQSEWKKMWTRITPNKSTFYAMVVINLKRECSENKEINCGEYLYEYFESCVIASLQIMCSMHSQRYIDLLKGLLGPPNRDKLFRNILEI